MNTEAQALAKLGREIAKHIPGWRCGVHWRCEVHGEYQTTFLVPEKWEEVDIPAGAHPFRGVVPHIHLQVDHKKRLNVSGHWPTEFDPINQSYNTVSPRDRNEPSPSISCNSTRLPEAIALDILRRFLPDYLRIHALCLERLRSNADNTKKQREVVKRFAAVVGDGRPNDTQTSWFAGRCYGHVHVNFGGDSGTLEIRGDTDILMAALEAMTAAGGLLTQGE